MKTVKPLLTLVGSTVFVGCLANSDPGQLDAGGEDDSAVTPLDAHADGSRVDALSDTTADTGKPPVDTGISPDTRPSDTTPPDTGPMDTGPTGLGCKLSDAKACGLGTGDGCLRTGGGATSCGKMGAGADGAVCAKDQDCRPGHICDAPGSGKICRRLCVVGSSDCGAPLTCKDFSTAFCGIGKCSSLTYGSVTYGFCGT